MAYCTALRMAFRSTALGLVSVVALAGCSRSERATDRSGSQHGDSLDPATLLARAKAFFAPLPKQADSPKNPITEAKVKLGHQLFFETRLSKSRTIACNSCHKLDAFGVDGEKTSPGHEGQRGDRNSPTVYNAALHFAQFWDGRAADVEEQAKGPVLNPVEMGMPSPESVESLLAAIPGYVTQFEAVFPESKALGKVITYDNVAMAIGAFERMLLTPSAFDRFLDGDISALSDDAQKGLSLFMDAGCTTCHSGVALGGAMYQKLGLIKAYETMDHGRFGITKQDSDKGVFKVPSLRNVAKTSPYFHDGSIESLDRAVAVMVEHQTTRGIFTVEENAAVVAFLESLTGELPVGFMQAPALPESGPQMPTL